MNLEFSRVGSSLACSAVSDSLIASLYTRPKFERVFPSLQISHPELSEPGDTFNIALLREWMESCDGNHICIPKDQAFFPTRVIDVGTEGSSVVRLASLSPAHAADRKYLALSHPWGSPATNTMFRTLQSNLIDFMEEGVMVTNLPRTFQDAIWITQRLSVRYLWIDSLCIVQDNNEDWEYESRLMEQVYSSACATIAATSASGTSSGFLNSHRGRKYVRMAKGGASYFVCDAIDNFHDDVEQADLNTRGWVLQERALSRRTIHFAKRQCYWECGGGVRCETLTKMNKSVLYHPCHLPTTLH